MAFAGAGSAESTASLGTVAFGAYRPTELICREELDVNFSAVREGIWRLGLYRERSIDIKQRIYKDITG